MKQLVQSLKSGETYLEEVPVPQPGPGHVLIRTHRSLVSLGTERMLVEFGRANLIAKARQQPEKVRMVLDKFKTDGILPTLEAVFRKLDQPLPLGYCNVGTVIEVGPDVTRFKVGDRVTSNGPHAEFVAVPQNLAARVPDNVSDDEAVFTVVSAIALHGIRLLNPTFGETIAVIGLGLIGLVASEFLHATGCQVIGTDPDPLKRELAQTRGVTVIDPANDSDHGVARIRTISGGSGVDGVLVAASSHSNHIIRSSAHIARKRGRIVLVGVVGLDIDRSAFYEKELSFQVSCSYGPGRYDDTYEHLGRDYPIPYVRWTENRNFQAVLNALAMGRISFTHLITNRCPLENFKTIYTDLSQPIAAVLTYPEASHVTRVVPRIQPASPPPPSPPSQGEIGIVGAGNFAQMVILPHLKAARAPLRYIASQRGITATTLAKKYDIPYITTSYEAVCDDPAVALVIIATRHNDHARMVIAGLRAHKHVFVEKPLALNASELNDILAVLDQSDRHLMVGFNRRFSPYAVKMKALIGDGPMHVVATMNAGSIPESAWVHDPKIGGGRLIGEACHYIDFITYLVGHKVVAVTANALGSHPIPSTDNATILLRYADGSNGVINYFANGSRAYPKERIEVYCHEKTLVLDNFRTLFGHGFKDFSTYRPQYRSKIDKGHGHQFRLLVQFIREGGNPLIPIDEIVNTTRASFAINESLTTQQWVTVK